MFVGLLPCNYLLLGLVTDLGDNFLDNNFAVSFSLIVMIGDYSCYFFNL